MLSLVWELLTNRHGREWFLKPFPSQISWHKNYQTMTAPSLQSSVVCSESRAGKPCWLVETWEAEAFFLYSRSTTVCLALTMWVNQSSEEASPELIFLVQSGSVCWDGKSAYFSDCWYGFLLADRWNEAACTGYQRTQRWTLPSNHIIKKVKPSIWLKDGEKKLDMIRHWSGNMDELLSSRSS